MRNLNWKSYAEMLGLVLSVLGGAYLILLSMSLGRPIWLDEFLQFAVSAEPSTSEAWALVHRSILGINHSQTGVYLMADYWLEKAGGASATMLRLPSILSGCFFIICTIEIFRRLKYSSAWTLLALFALLGQSMTMYFIGEARPYFPLAAASAGALLFYMTPVSERRIVIRAIGWAAITIGALFHPYFAFYWVAIAGVTYVSNSIDRWEAPSLSTALRHIDAPLCVFGSIIYFYLAFTFWLHSPKDFKMDPFQLTPDPVGTFLHTHFEFLSPYGPYTAAGTVVAIAIAAMFWEETRGSLKGLILPLLLLLVMLLLSVFVSWASYHSNYWIIYRQWVASAALMPILIVWVWAETARIFSRIDPWLGPAIFLVGVAASYIQADVVYKMRWYEYAKFKAEAAKTERVCDHTKITTPSDGFNESFVRWVALANDNIQCGGPVWPELRKYYLYAAPKPSDGH